MRLSKIKRESENDKKKRLFAMQKDTEERRKNIEKILAKSRSILQQIDFDAKIHEIEELQEKNKGIFEKTIKFKKKKEIKKNIKSILIYTVCAFLLILFFYFFMLRSYLL
jgi:hypothetical protein